MDSATKSRAERVISRSDCKMDPRMTPKPVVLMILDGFGAREAAPDNAISHARTPTFDQLTKRVPHALLATSGEAVGLPKGQMG